MNHKQFRISVKNKQQGCPTHTQTHIHQENIFGLFLLFSIFDLYEFSIPGKENRESNTNTVNNKVTLPNLKYTLSSM